MSRDEIMELGLEALEERSAAIAEETREANEEVLEQLNAELDVIEERSSSQKQNSAKRMPQPWPPALAKLSKKQRRTK